MFVANMHIAEATLNDVDWIITEMLIEQTA
jgi:hypothetical protein